MDSSFSFDMRRKKSLTFQYNTKSAPSQEDRSGREQMWNILGCSFY